VYYINCMYSVYCYLNFFTGGVYMNSILPDFCHWWSLHEPNFTCFIFLAEFTLKKVLVAEFTCSRVVWCRVRCSPTNFFPSNRCHIIEQRSDDTAVKSYLIEVFTRCSPSAVDGVCTEQYSAVTITPSLVGNLHAIYRNKKILKK